MKTIILDADDAATNYLNIMLEHINSDLKYNTVLDTAESLSELGKNVKDMTSTTHEVAFNSFREQFLYGSTMMLLSEEDGRNLQLWNDRNEDYQIAIFRHDGKPVGLYKKDVLNW